MDPPPQRGRQSQRAHEGGARPRLVECFLTRRRGGAEEEAENSVEKVKTKARSQREPGDRPACPRGTGRSVPGPALRHMPVKACQRFFMRSAKLGFRSEEHTSELQSL